jgi:prepilin-type N-terminal cleavage/methylation domain-containing protein
MKKLSQKGFSALEVLLVVVIVGAIAGLGWWLWNRQAEDNKQPVANVVETIDDKTVVLAKDGDVTVVTTSLPQDWKLKKCIEKGFVLYHKDGGAKCRTENTDVFGGVIAPPEELQTKDCSSTDQKKKEAQESDWLVSYECEEIEINGRGAVKVISEYEDKEGGIKAKSHQYVIDLGNDAYLEMSYEYSYTDMLPNFEKTFDEFAKTIKTV